MYASAMCVRLGAASQAAFEVIRQLWIVSIQLFECLNVATQSMAATLLGAGDRAGARALLARANWLSIAVGAGVGAGLLALQAPLVGIFTSDPTVAAMCAAIIPMIALLMPVDAGASIADGGFIAAGQTNTLSAIQVHRGVRVCVWGGRLVELSCGVGWGMGPARTWGRHSGRSAPRSSPTAPPTPPAAPSLPLPAAARAGHRQCSAVRGAVVGGNFRRRERADGVGGVEDDVSLPAGRLPLHLRDGSWSGGGMTGVGGGG
jgi:hypothetical protein